MSDVEKPPAKRRREGKGARYSEMMTFILDERRRAPFMPYAKGMELLKERFGGSKRAHNRVMAEANEAMRQAFDEQCRDVPRVLFDAYMEIHEEAMRRGNLREATRTLDSVRDMFGLRAAINVNVNTGIALPSEQYNTLTEAQLEALAVIDAATLALSNGHNVIDVPSVEDSLDIATTED